MGARRRLLVVIGALLASAAPVASQGPGDLCLLMARVRAFNQLIEGRQFSKLEAYLSVESRDFAEQEEGYIKEMTRKLREYRATVEAIATTENRARVQEHVIGVFREKGRNNLDEQSTSYWILEDGDWYRLAIPLSRWSEAEAELMELPDCPEG